MLAVYGCNMDIACHSGIGQELLVWQASTENGLINLTCPLENIA
jgi:hypothetical protein